MLGAPVLDIESPCSGLNTLHSAPGSILFSSARTAKTLDKRSCYDVTKMYIETISYIFKDQFNVDCKIVRPFNVIGYFRQDDKRVIPNFISNCLKGEKMRIYAPGDQTRTFCWYGDFLSGCIQVLTEGKDILYHIGNPSNEISMIDLAKMVEKTCGKKNMPLKK